MKYPKPFTKNPKSYVFWPNEEFLLLKQETAISSRMRLLYQQKTLLPHHHHNYPALVVLRVQLQNVLARIIPIECTMLIFTSFLLWRWHQPTRNWSRRSWNGQRMRRSINQETLLKRVISENYWKQVWSLTAFLWWVRFWSSRCGLRKSGIGCLSRVLHIVLIEYWMFIASNTWKICLLSVRFGLHTKRKWWIG